MELNLSYLDEPMKDELRKQHFQIIRRTGKSKNNLLWAKNGKLENSELKCRCHHCGHFLSTRTKHKLLRQYILDCSNCNWKRELKIQGMVVS